jgi:DNA segregation ATPase FtsK/SpoIIIE-like protein
MKNNNSEDSHRELLDDVKEIQQLLFNLNDTIEDLIFRNELPYLLKKIAKLKKSGKVKRITTAFLQKELHIGYARAARLLMELKMKKLKND